MSLEATIAPLVERATKHRSGRPLVVGICGAQGSGKSTLSRALCARIPRSVTLSIDDLYLTRAERQALARDVHPLLRTRGVPGTHDVGLGIGVLDTIGSGVDVALPRFDKANDDRAPLAEWPSAPADTEIVFFEGWCVGATPQPGYALEMPINDLESEEDKSGIWRRFANEALAGRYQALFDRIDILVLLAAPNWDVVATWRLDQEQALRRSGGSGPGMMTDSECMTFISHYERLTRHILREMPNRADVTVKLDRQRVPFETVSNIS